MSKTNNVADELEPTNDPGANTSHIIADAFKDHSKGVNAVLYEILQNSFDAYQYHTSEGNIDTGLTVKFRVNKQEGTIEAWDTAGGMTKTVLIENYLKLGNPGSYKIGSDTGGSQGKGFWAMSCWGEESYIHSLDRDGTEWCARAIQKDRRAERSDVKKVEKTTYDSRSELTQPGTYVRIENLDSQTLTDLCDWDTVNEKISRKFAFALADENVSVEYEIVGDGTYSPTTYDLENLIEQGAIVEDVDLPMFTKKGEKRQLKSLYLIDNRRIADNIEPPWKGVAMLKGGEYTTGHPYLSVWEYIPDQHPVTREGKMWGFVDASELAPDLEEHGHTGFIGSGSLYKDSGLREAIFDASEEYYHDQTIEDQEEASEFGVENINHFMEEFNDIDASGGGSGGTETPPNEPILRVNSGKHVHEVGSEVGVSVSVKTSGSCNVEDVLIKGEIIKTTGEDGGDPPEEVKQESHFEIEVEETGINTPPDEFVEIATGVYPTEKYGPGVYTFNAELYEHPNPDGPKTIGGFDTETALKGKPILSKSKSIFNVGDVDAETQPTGQSNNDGIVKAVQFKHGGDAPWRTQTKQTNDGDGYIVAINMDHPEYKAFKELHNGYTISDIQRDLCTKWGFFRIHFGQAQNEISDILEEHNIQNSQVTSEMKNTIQEYIENYDEFRKEFVTESPITGDLDIDN